MPQILRPLLALCAVATLAACAAPQEEFVVPDPEPITQEPVYTGKYK